MCARHAGFVKGHLYQVIKTFSKFSERFLEGKRMILVDEVYSRYDGMRIFVFRDVDSGESRSLEIMDDENLINWRMMFEEVSSTGQP